MLLLLQERRFGSDYVAEKLTMIAAEHGSVCLIARGTGRLVEYANRQQCAVAMVAIQ